MKHKKGQSMVEYVVVLTLCTLLSYATINTFHTNLKKVYNNAAKRTGLIGMQP